MRTARVGSEAMRTSAFLENVELTAWIRFNIKIIRAILIVTYFNYTRLG